MNAVVQPTRRLPSVDDYRLLAEAGERGYGRVDVLDPARPVALPTLGIDVDLSILFP